MGVRVSSAGGQVFDFFPISVPFPADSRRTRHAHRFYLFGPRPSDRRLARYRVRKVTHPVPNPYTALYALLLHYYDDYDYIIILYTVACNHFYDFINSSVSHLRQVSHTHTHLQHLCRTLPHGTQTTCTFLTPSRRRLTRPRHIEII